MRNKLLIFLCILAILGGTGYAFRGELFNMVAENVVADMFVDIDDDAFDPGPQVGSELPEIFADANGVHTQDLTQFSGERGLVVMLNRSLDWCIYCKKQTIELNSNISGFIENGLGVVMVIYDPPAIRDSFIAEHGIHFPVLTDIDTVSVRALDVLNAEYSPGDNAYGIPYPGTIVATPDGAVVGKLFVESYAKRLSSKAVLQQALQWLPSGNPAGVSSDSTDQPPADEGVVNAEGAVEGNGSSGITITNFDEQGNPIEPASAPESTAPAPTTTE